MHICTVIVHLHGHGVYLHTFTKHPHRFIYFTHSFNKIFILFTFFIISFPLEQTYKLVFSVEPHPHPISHPSTKSVKPHPHPSFNKITYTHPATAFSVELQTQHKPKITHTQPPATINDQIEQTCRNHRRSLSQGLGSSDHGLPRKPVVIMWSEMREADQNHGPSESPLYLIGEADRIVGSERLIGFDESEVRKKMRKREWGELEVERGEERRGKKEKSFIRWTVIMHICTVIVHLHGHGVYLHIFTKTYVDVFWIRMCKIGTFFYFKIL